VRTADIAIIKTQYVIAKAHEVLTELLRPAGELRAQAHDEKNRLVLGITLGQIFQVHVVDCDVWQKSSLLSSGKLTRTLAALKDGLATFNK
jgi:hypothetical protein